MLESDSDDVSSVTILWQLSIPDIPVLPLFTSIPFKIDVNTITAAVVRHTRRDGSRDSGHARIFPTPPSDPSEVTFQLVRRLKIRAHKREETRQSVTTRYIAFVGTSCCERVDVDVPEKEWVQMHDVSTSESSHSTKERGVWVQCAQFKSKLVFNVPPTFSIRDRLEWEVRPHLQLGAPNAHGSRSTFSSLRCRFLVSETMWSLRCL